MNTERDRRYDVVKTQPRSTHEENKQTHSQILYFTATTKMSGLVAVAAASVAEPPPPAAAKPPSPPPPARGPWPRC